MFAPPGRPPAAPTARLHSPGTGECSRPLGAARRPSGGENTCPPRVHHGQIQVASLARQRPARRKNMSKGGAKDKKLAKARVSREEAGTSHCVPMGVLVEDLPLPDLAHVQPDSPTEDERARNLRNV